MISDKVLYRNIAYGYLIKNYSSGFVNRCKDDIRANSKGRVEIACKSTGNSFQLKINLSKKTIVHLGCYQINKGFDSSSIIEFNLNNFRRND